MKRFLTLLIFVVAAIVVVPLVVTNRHDVILHLYPFGLDLALPLYAVFFAGFILGVLMMGFVSISSRMKASFDVFKAQREVKRLTERLNGVGADTHENTGN